MTREQHIKEIMEDAIKSGDTPLTREQAEEIADMEDGEKEIKNYVSSTPTKKKVKRERKVDAEKETLLSYLAEGLANHSVTATAENEVRLHFAYNNAEYSVTLTKHRPPKN